MRNLRSIRDAYSNGLLPKADYIEQCFHHHAALFEYAELMAETDITKIEITADQVIFNINHRAAKLKGLGPKFYVQKGDHRAVPLEIFNFKSYEHDDFSMMLKLTKGANVIFDVGANIGYHSVNLASLYREAKIYSFEPIPTTFSQLKKNLEVNEITNVKAFNLGLSDQIGEATFYYYLECTGNASLANLTGRDAVVPIQSQLSTVDTIREKERLRIDFIKCDVEGAELFVFKGAHRTLSEDRPIVFSEILRKWSSGFGYNPNEIFSFFRELNYSAFTTKNNKLVPFGNMDDETIETNFFFIPNEKVTDLKL